MRTIARRGFATVRVEDTDKGVLFCAYDICRTVNLTVTGMSTARFVEHTAGVGNITTLTVG